MSKIVSSLFISLDGVVEAPDQWSMEYFDEDMGKEMDTQIQLLDAVLLGRVSYVEWAGYWPTSTDEPFASFINNIPKYVFSKTLDTVEWKNSTLVKGDLLEEVNRLKQQYGRNIGVTASPTLVRSLIAHDLLDQLHLQVHPVVAGKGRKLFKDGDSLKKLKLVDNRTTSSGIVMLTYQLDRG
jgi:dihydrofolate reductase